MKPHNIQLTCLRIAGKAKPLECFVKRVGAKRGGDIKQSFISQEYQGNMNLSINI